MRHLSPFLTAPSFPSLQTSTSNAQEVKKSVGSRSRRRELPQSYRGRVNRSRVGRNDFGPHPVTKHRSANVLGDVSSLVTFGKAESLGREGRMNADGGKER